MTETATACVAVKVMAFPSIYVEVSFKEYLFHFIGAALLLYPSGLDVASLIASTSCRYILCSSQGAATEVANGSAELPGAPASYPVGSWAAQVPCWKLAIEFINDG